MPFTHRWRSFVRRSGKSWGAVRWRPARRNCECKLARSSWRRHACKTCRIRCVQEPRGMGRRIRGVPLTTISRARGSREPIRAEWVRAVHCKAGSHPVCARGAPVLPPPLPSPASCPAQDRHSCRADHLRFFFGFGCFWIRARRYPRGRGCRWPYAGRRASRAQDPVFRSLGYRHTRPTAYRVGRRRDPKTP